MVDKDLDNEPLLRTLNEAESALNALVDALVFFQGQLRMTYHDVKRRSQIVQTLEKVHGTETRERLAVAQEDFEVARKHLRIELIRYGVSQGASIAEVGRALGVSRQYAAQLVSEDTR